MTRIITTVASLAGQSARHWKLCADLEPVYHVTVNAESCVTAARNRCLTEVMRFSGSWDVCLMLDDDVYLDVNDALDLCLEASARGCPVAALYPDSHGNVRVQFALHPYDASRRILLAGLGALAIPRQHLESLSTRLPNLALGETKRTVQPFCISGPSVDGRAWWNEDAWLCYNLGGVVPSVAITAEHQKSQALQLSASSFAAIKELINEKLSEKEGNHDDVG